MLVSDVLGNLSQLFWLFAQLPQIWKNHRSKSVQGLSLPFLLNWLSGDVTNLIGCLLTNQLAFQRNLAIYFNIIDLVLIAQFALYSRVHPPTSQAINNQPDHHHYTPISETHLERQPPSNPIEIESSPTNSKLGLDLSPHAHPHSHQSAKAACPQLLHPGPPLPSNQPINWNANPNNNPSNPFCSTPSRFTRTGLRYCNLKSFFFLAVFGLIALQITTYNSSPSFRGSKSAVSLAQPSTNHNHTSASLQAHNQTQDRDANPIPTSGSPLRKLNTQEELEASRVTNEQGANESVKQKIGRLSAWLCAFLYLTSRIPQIMKNYSRKSVEGLSILLFVLAFLGNLTYVLSILSSPQTMLTKPDRNTDHRPKLDYLNESVPYLIGSAGTLCFDLTIFIQSRLYRGPPSTCSSIHRRPSSPPPSPSITCSNLINPSPPLPSPPTIQNPPRLNPEPENYATRPLLSSRSTPDLV